ncbi:MAG: LuxR C-terminal-related transcriptional regulator [Phyllobacterium sp.]
MRALETRYARNGDVRIAYQVVGQGAFDLVFVPGDISNLDVHWEYPEFAHFLERLSTFSRLLLFDKRGTGLSDRVDAGALPDLATRVDDMRAVMEAAGSGRAAFLGEADGVAMALLFAATYPERTRALVLYGGYAHFHSSVLAPEPFETFLQKIDKQWGRGVTLPHFAPGQIDNQRLSTWWARLERLSASPTSAIALARMNATIDVREILSGIRVPTIVIHRMNDVYVSAEGSRHLVANIADASFIGLPGSDHPIWTGDADRVVDPVEEFLTGTRPVSSGDRILAALLVTRVAGSNHHGSDHEWRKRLENFHEMATSLFGLYGGHVVGWDTENITLRFDGAARAAQCALALRDIADTLDLPLSQGVHVGEVEVSGSLVTGTAVHISELVASAAHPNDVLVSSLVVELATGSGLRFVENGAIDVPGQEQPLRVLSVAAEQHLEPLKIRKTEPSLVSLTMREREVLDHITDGRSNAAIALRLDLSEHTVKRHVANILLKLDLPTRAAAAAFSARQARS